MGLINTEQLLAPLPGANPSGSNLEYDSDFTALERAAQGRPEQRMGNAIVPAEPPDWAAVLERCVALLGRTRDLRVGVQLAIALLHRGGFVGFSEGLTVVHGMLAQFWPTVHPELDHEEGDDPTMRITALTALCTPSVLQTMRTTELARARALGGVCFRDIQVLATASTSDNTPAVDAATLEGIFQEVDAQALEAVVAAVKSCSEQLIGVDTVFETHTGSRGPDLTPLIGLLRDISNAVAPRLAARRAALGLGNVMNESGSPQSAEQISVGASGPALTGEIRSREDVVKAIDKICAYYARSEPTSPLPLLLERCKRLVSSSFLDIIRDLAPDSVPQVERLGGRKPE